MIVPTRRQLFAAMQQRYQNGDHLTVSLLSTCAEVAEQVFNRARLKHLNEQLPVKEVPIHKRRSGNSGNFTVRGYRCPECTSLEVRLDYKHCPNCGVKIEWHQEYVRHLKKAA